MQWEWRWRRRRGLPWRWRKCATSEDGRLSDIVAAHHGIRYHPRLACFVGLQPLLGHAYITPLLIYHCNCISLVSCRIHEMLVTFCLCISAKENILFVYIPFFYFSAYIYIAYNWLAANSARQLVVLQIHTAIILYNYYHRQNKSGKHASSSIFDRVAMQACEITWGLDASKDSPDMALWSISKVAVLLLDPTRKKVFDGV